MYRRWLWPGFALPGVIWLIVLFLVPFYTVLAVALWRRPTIKDRDADLEDRTRASALRAPGS